MVPLILIDTDQIVSMQNEMEERERGDSKRRKFARDRDCLKIQSDAQRFGYSFD